MHQISLGADDQLPDYYLSILNVNGNPPLLRDSGFQFGGFEKSQSGIGAKGAAMIVIGQDQG